MPISGKPEIGAEHLRITGLTLSSIAMTETFKIEIAPSELVTALRYPAASSRDAGPSLLLAHGAGANQTSGFMVHFASALAARAIETITFNFLYTEQRRRLPDRNDKLEACYRAMVAAWHDGAFGPRRGPLVIGGKSMGGRIASQIAAAEGARVAGVLLLGYPLHPPAQPEKLRTRHLPGITQPMLFVQGARDSFGTPEELRPILAKLKASVELVVIENGDHSFKVPKKGAISQEQVYAFVLDRIAQWMGGLVDEPRP
jgi:predicted alpha/beta-hydrolase family hydrolase